MDGRPHTVFKVQSELSSGHKCQLRDRGCEDHKISVYLFLSQQRAADCGRQRQSETTEPICIKWVNVSVWKVQSAPFFCFPPPHTERWLFLARSGPQETPYLSLCLRLFQFVINGIPPLPNSLTARRARAGPVKLLKWYYSRQFFSLYLKCLNVWQDNQSSDLPPGRVNRKLKHI